MRNSKGDQECSGSQKCIMHLAHGVPLGEQRERDYQRLPKRCPQGLNWGHRREYVGAGYEPKVAYLQGNLGVWRPRNQEPD